MKKTKKRLLYGAAVVFWLVVWQLAAMAIGQEVFLVSPIQALGILLELLPQPEFWQRIGFSAGRILLGFLLFGESITLRQFIGAAVIIVGIVLFVRADNEGEGGQ